MLSIRKECLKISKLIEIAALDITLYKFALPLMDSLRANSFEIIAAANNSGYRHKLIERGYDVFQIDFVRNLSPFKNFRAFLQVIRLFRQEKPDIIHVHTPIASVLARIAAKLTLKDTAIIYTLHGLNKNPVFLFVEYIVCKYMTDHIFTVNKADMKHLIRHKFIKKDNIACLNSVGIDTNRFNKESIDTENLQALKASLKIKDKPVIGFVGRPVDIKGFGELVDAFINIRQKFDCQLLVVGAAYLSERDTETLLKAKKRLAASGFNKDVIFTGQRDDIPQMLCLMDIFVQASKWEGMCTTVLEAMSMGLPVIGTDIRGIREEITEKTGILVPVEDVGAIVRAMEQLLIDSEKRISMGKHGRCRVIKHFNEKTKIKEQVDVFNCIQARKK